MLEIGFDIDGVVFDITEVYLRIAREQFGLLKTAKYSDVTIYNYHDCLDISYEDSWKIINYILSNPEKVKGKAIAGAVEVLTRLSKYYDYLTFITARADNMNEHTMSFLTSILPKVNKNKINIYYAKEKYKILKGLNIKYFIDDSLINYKSLKEKGLKPFIFDQPWNQDKKVSRVKNWNDIWNLAVGGNWDLVVDPTWNINIEKSVIHNV